MATNYEFYKDGILKWFTRDGSICGLYSEITGNVLECDGDCEACGKILADFLEQEHIEVPKLTKRERAFCEYAKTGYIVRESHIKNAFLHNALPYQEDGEWFSDQGRTEILFSAAPFEFIKFTDETPWSVEDLLKLAVEE